MEKVLLNIDKGIATVTINNTKALNALSVDVMEEIIETFNKIDRDASVVVAVITGAGDKAFAAGADLTTFETATQETGITMSKLGQLLCDTIAHCRVPVIAAVNGVAFGGGMETTLACDIRLAAENAKFGQQEVIWGIMPAWGGTQRLPQLVGKSDAMKILLTGEPINAQEAYRMGLVSGVYPQADLMNQAYELAKKIVNNGPDNVRFIKKVVAEGETYITRAGLAMEGEMLGRCFNSGEPWKRVEKFLANSKKKN